MTPDSPVLGDEGRARLQQKAESDRTARPWRYYELDREVLLKMLDEQAGQLAAVRAPCPAPPEATEIIGRCPTCHHANYQTSLPEGPFTETQLSAHSRFRMYPPHGDRRFTLFLLAQWEDYVWLSTEDAKPFVAAVLSASLGRPSETKE